MQIMHSTYLKPLSKPTLSVWFSKQPVGHNKLPSTVAHLCKAAEIAGFKTYHFLWATTATHLFHRDVDEQLIMERTGHRSINGVRSYMYKRPYMQQQERFPSFLTQGRKSLVLLIVSTSQRYHKLQTRSPVREKSASINEPKPLESLIFNSCSSITININWNNQSSLFITHAPKVHY